MQYPLTLRYTKTLYNSDAYAAFITHMSIRKPRTATRGPCQLTTDLIGAIPTCHWTRAKLSTHSSCAESMREWQNKSMKAPAFLVQPHRSFRAVRLARIIDFSDSLGHGYSV
ncbi:uncharacterized protein MYCFIDRAFT_197481 [Pseudocercospora fijiensis CIRAD86]|uniref:Uncharacterized protein n=1 Tax=Pseudocercospora fijiensis (strain CIRAD86) TaxID=383855 RepID=M2ZTK4_PSEFD|nr:uncharacterized protein MYCFIDRAFT_197481 [Pseudocercospora fijiensis CIRAD86]EME82334.1 hypothetical protein MYCFIDRAFT_197481 [Pseudocercospora fijiensis CIRAD86]